MYYNTIQEIAMVVAVRIDEEMKARLDALAAQQKRTPSALMREAIEQYLDREAGRDRFLQEALASWTHYKETGLHITEDELNKWLDTWGTDKEADPPQCHV
jgi:predicted transcriptional regulator